LAVLRALDWGNSDRCPAATVCAWRTGLEQGRTLRTQQAVLGFVAAMPSGTPANFELQICNPPPDVPALSQGITNRRRVLAMPVCFT
jgi:hypothetical protein